MADLKTKMQEKATGAGAVTTTAKPRTIADSLQALVPQLARVLPKHISPDKMARIALTQYKQVPALQNCTEASFFGSLLTLAQLGLEPGPLGHAYLIPYKGVCTVQIGYRGMLELVSRSDKVDTVYAYPVYKGDHFKHRLGAQVNIEHEPGDGVEPTDANLTHVYAVAHIKGSSMPRIEVMTKLQVDAIRKRSSAGNSGPWVTDYAEMAKKTVLKKLCKTLPLAVEVQSAIAKDETTRLTVDSDDVVSMFDVPSVPAVTTKVEQENIEDADVSTGEVELSDADKAEFGGKD